MKFKIFLFVACLCLALPSESFSEDILSFGGDINISKKEVDFNIDLNPEGSLSVSSKMKDDGDLSISVDIEHFKALGYDISSEIRSLIEFAGKGKASANAIHGKVWSNYSLLDFRPIRELTGHFEVKNKKLFLRSFAFGNIAFNGSIDLVPPFKMDLVFKLAMIEMNDFLDFWMKNRTYDSGGLVSGTIGVAGTIDKLFLKGKLESHDGFIKKVRFNSLFLNLNGVYPNLEIFNSSISEKDGFSFTLSGPIDLSDTKNFKKQIQNLTFLPEVRGEGSDVEWTIKKYDKDRDASDTTELKYFLQKDPGAGLLSNEGSGVLGVERKISF